MEDVIEQIREAWQTNNRISLFLIEAISDEGLSATLSTRGGRTVARQFGHMHTNRVWHLEERARDLAAGLYKFEAKEEPSRARLAQCFRDSGERIESFLVDCAGGAAKRRPLKKGVVATLGYLVAHESHHRGNILLTLKQSGHGLDQATRYAIWNWDKM